MSVKRPRLEVPTYKDPCPAWQDGQHCWKHTRRSGITGNVVTPDNDNVLSWHCVTVKLCQCGARVDIVPEHAAGPR